MKGNPRPSSRPHYGYLILVLVVLAIFCSLGLGRFGYSMVLPAMREHLELSNAQTGRIQSWNLLGYMLTVAFAGALAARIGPRRVIAAALALVGLSMAATGLWPRLGAIHAARFLTGVGGAAANVPAMGLVSAWFAPRRRGLASGIAVAGSSLGLVVTGPLVPAVLRLGGDHGWRLNWAVFGAMALLGAVLCGALLRNRPEELGLRPVGGNAAPPAASPAVVDRHWSSVYRSAYLWRLAAVYFGFGFAYIIFATYFVEHLVRTVGLEARAAGGLWMRIGLVSSFSGLLWGSLSDRIGRRPAVVIVFTLQAVGFGVLYASPTLNGAYVSAALFALTAWSVPALVAALCGDHFGGRLAPAALGLVTIVFGFGQVLGPVVAGLLADRTASFAAAFGTAGLVALVVGAGGALSLPAHSPEAE